MGKNRIVPFQRCCENVLVSKANDEIKLEEEYSHLKLWSMCNISCKLD